MFGRLFAPFIAHAGGTGGVNVPNSEVNAPTSGPPPNSIEKPGNGIPLASLPARDAGHLAALPTRHLSAVLRILDTHAVLVCAAHLCARRPAQASGEVWKLARP